MDITTPAARNQSRTEEPEAPAALTDRVRSLRLSSQHGRRNSTSTVAWLLVIIFAGTSAYLGYREYERGGTPQPTQSGIAAAAPAESVSEKAVEKGNSTSSAPTPVADSGTIALESKGYLVPAHQILVSPKVSGMVTKLFIEEGMRVEKGQVLGELEKVDYEADLSRSKATVDLFTSKLALMKAEGRDEDKKQADLELAETERQLVQLKQEYERSRALRAQDRSLVSDSAFEEQQSNYEATALKAKRLAFRRDMVYKPFRKEEIDSAQAELAQAQADLIKAEWRLSNCTIKAPISGTVLKKNAEEGNIVNPVAFNGSFSLCDLADLSDLEVDLSIQERDFSKVYPRQACQVRSDAYPDRIYVGVVDRLMPIADRAKGAIPVRVKVKVDKGEEGVYLKPDMSAVVTFLNKRADDSASPGNGKSVKAE